MIIEKEGVDKMYSKSYPRSKCSNVAVSLHRILKNLEEES